MHRPFFQLALVGTLIVGAAGGCATTYSFARTTRATAPPKPDGCAFDIFSTRPLEAFDELGVVEAHPSIWGAGPVTDVDVFRQAIAHDVCANGADAVIGEINGNRHYLRGTLIRFRKPAGDPRAVTALTKP